MFDHLVLMPDGTLAEGCCPSSHGSHDDAWWSGAPCGACGYWRPDSDESNRLLRALLFDRPGEFVEMGDADPVSYPPRREN